MSDDKVCVCVWGAGGVYVWVWVCDIEICYATSNLHEMLPTNFFHVIKLRRLASPNRIIDNSKLDFNKFGRQLYDDDSDFKVKIVTSISILINFRSHFN